MQKKVDVNAIIDGNSYHLRLIKTLVPNFHLEDFSTEYPQLYFAPKEQNLEFFSSGSIYTSSDFIHLQSNVEIPCFFVGDNNIYKSWGDLQKSFHVIPNKWVIKSGSRAIKYEWDNQSTIILKAYTFQTLLPTDVQHAIASIESIKSNIEKEIFSKYVLAIMQKESLNDRLEISTLRQYPVSGTKFFYKFSERLSFLGLTPEWLYKRYKKDLSIDAIAGTSSLENIPDLQTKKIIEEFAFVKKDIKESMMPFVEYGKFKDHDSVILAGHLAHRYNCFKACLKEGITDKCLVEHLHPTAAISGYPKKVAQQYFSQFETCERGYFASPIGVYFGKRSYIAVAIRSMLVCNDEAYLFAGAGITKDSIPEHEWQELNKKTNLMRQFLTFINS